MAKKDITTRFDEYKHPIHKYKGIEFFEFFEPSADTKKKKITSYFQLIPSERKFKTLKEVIAAIDEMKKKK